MKEPTDGALTIRPYRPEDLEACESMVGQVWQFEERLPPDMAQFASQAYTQGSLAGSNVAWVADADAQVVGLLFGRVGHAPVYRTALSGAAGQIKAMLGLLQLPAIGLTDKARWLRAAIEHESTVSKLKEAADELTLIVVGPDAQGKGIGRRLIELFLGHCEDEGVSRIAVETDIDSNYGFYEHLGFVRIHEFESPLNALLTGSSGESFIYELDLS